MCVGGGFYKDECSVCLYVWMCCIEVTAMCVWVGGWVGVFCRGECNVCVAGVCVYGFYRSDCSVCVGGLVL